MNHTSLEAERSVLGILLKSERINNQNADVIQNLHEDLFTTHIHKIVCRVILLNVSKQMPFDFIMVSQYIDDFKLFPDDSFALVAELVDSCVTLENLNNYFKVLEEKLNTRKLAALFNQGADILHNSGDDIEKQENALKLLSGFNMDEKQELFLKPLPMAERFIDRLQSKIESKSGLAGLSFGYNKLDELTLGADVADYIAICGKPSSGKTALMMNCMLKNLRNGESVIFYSVEMSEASVVDRFISAMARVDVGKIRSGNFFKYEDMNDADSRDFDRVGKALAEYKTFDLTIIDKGAMHIHDVEMMTRTHVIKNGSVDWVYVDYWQKLRSDGKTPVQELENSSGKLKDLAKEHKCRVVVGAQLRKDAIGEPTPSQIKGSAKLEEDTDILMFVHSDNENYKPISGQMSQVILAKVRNGMIGTMAVNPEMKYQTFIEHDGEYIPKEKPKKSFNKNEFDI